MTRNHLFVTISVTVLLLLVLLGCGAPATPTPIPPTDKPTSIPPTAIPTPTLTPQPIEVTFDGNECTVSGPTELPIGEHSFIRKDLTGNDAELYVEYYIDGKTLQDYLDLQSEPGEYVSDQPWAIRSIKRGTEWNESLGGKEYTFLLNEGGEHIIIIAGFSPRSIWFCAPLWVIAAPSE